MVNTKEKSTAHKIEMVLGKVIIRRVLFTLAVMCFAADSGAGDDDVNDDASAGCIKWRQQQQNFLFSIYLSVNITWLARDGW